MDTKITYHHWKVLDEPGSLTPIGEEIQIWIGEVPVQEHPLTPWTSWLDESERLRADRFQVAASRNEFVFGRALLRRVLAACLDIRPAEVAFVYGDHGKPRMARKPGHDDLRFNLAHSHSLVTIALSRGRDVGVDIEWINHSLDWAPLAKRVFSSRELEEIHALPAPQQRLAFFKGWTRKEAFLKATGAGLSDGIQEIEVTMNPDQPAAFLPGTNPHWNDTFWKIQDLPLPTGFAGALVFERRQSYRK